MPLPSAPSPKSPGFSAIDRFLRSKFVTVAVLIAGLAALAIVCITLYELGHGRGFTVTWTVAAK